MISSRNFVIGMVVVLFILSLLAFLLTVRLSVHLNVHIVKRIKLKSTHKVRVQGAKPLAGGLGCPPDRVLPLHELMSVLPASHFSLGYLVA